MGFAVEIVNLYKKLSEEKREYVLSKQILRSGTSIGANLYEAQKGISKNDFLAKIYISLKEVDKDIIDEILLNSNINLKIICLVLFPIKKEYILSGVLQTLGLGLKVLVMSEILTQGENTIGGKIQLAKSFLDAYHLELQSLLIPVLSPIGLTFCPIFSSY